jgi:tRNA pseudouridine55 synthase
MMDGILLIDKPAGPTSHDIVQEIKRLLGAEKTGHLGTLDPMATGLLPLVINGATKSAGRYKDSIKEYEFDIILGFATDTDDEAGRVIRESPAVDNAGKLLEKILPSFTGEIMQAPPAYSAVKIGGVPLYKIARKGKGVLLNPRPVTIYDLCFCEGAHEEGKGSQMRFHLRMMCSSGTYVRALCRDIGERLCLFGHAANIRRTKSGPFDIKDAVSMEEFRALTHEQRKKLIRPVSRVDNIRGPC